jgi:hypothetical protein
MSKRGVCVDGGGGVVALWGAGGGVWWFFKPFLCVPHHVNQSMNLDM